MKTGNLPASKTGITLSRKGVLVTSFGPNVFGEGAVPINLRSENAGNAITIKDNSFEIEIEAYKPASFLLEM